MGTVFLFIYSGDSDNYKYVIISLNVSSKFQLDPEVLYNMKLRHVWKIGDGVCNLHWELTLLWWKIKKLWVEEVDSLWKFWVLLDFRDLSCNRLCDWRFSVIKRCYEYIYSSESLELLGEGPFKDFYWIQILLWHTNWHFWETKRSQVTWFVCSFKSS